MKKKIILVGGGGHCRSCVEVLESTKRYLITGIVGFPEQVGGIILGYPIVGSDLDLPQLLLANCNRALVTVGQIKFADPRIHLFDLLSKLGAEVPVVIAASALVSRHANIGQGTIVMHGAIINAGATIGENCIVNSRSLVEHDTHVDDHCHISTNAVLNGGVRVGRETFVGSGSIVHQNIEIGHRCTIGAGAIITKNIESDSLVQVNQNINCTSR